MKVEPVVIRFTRQIFYDNSQIYQAEVRKSPLLLRGGPLRADIEAQLADFRTLFVQRITADHTYAESRADTNPEIERETRSLTGLGEQLYALLPAALREGLPRLLQHAFDKRHSIRLIFEARASDQADQLLSIPWEIIYIKEFKTHLGLMPQVTIERHLLETVRKARPTLDLPFRIAHIIAQSSDYDPIAPELIAAECDAISLAAGQDEHYALVTNPGSVEHLLDQLAQKPYQIIHFLGHGDLDRDSAQSYLIFSGEQSTPQLVTAEQLSNLLGASPDTQIMVLNACHGASVEAGNIALRLVYYGIPYVIAMQGEVLQKAAAIFATTFYAAIQQGECLEEALARSRRAIAIRAPGAIDWALPALYVSSGIAQPLAPERVIMTIEQWLSQPAGKRQLSYALIGMGAAQLVVGSLLLLSGSAPVPPDPGTLARAAILLAPFPPLLALLARAFGRLPIPNEEPLRVRHQVALLLRLFSATSIGLGLPAFFAWLILFLVAGMGFWAILAPTARTLLLVLLFAPSLALSWQQAQGHGRGFLSNAEMAQPSLDWQELFVVAAGYIMLCLPLLLAWLMPHVLAPPWGNLIAGVFVGVLGYLLHKEATSA